MLLVSLVGILVEALALGVAAAVLVFEVVTGTAQQAAPTLATGAFGLLLAALLVGSARALWRGRRWARGPLITWQVLQGAVALSQVGSPWLSAALVGLSVVVLAGLLAPASIAATSRSGDAPPT